MLDGLLLLWTTALPLMGGPGPVTLGAAAMGTAFGVRRSIPYVLGVSSGTLTVLCLLASGVTGLVVLLPQAVPVLVAVAAAYILYLAWRIATAPVGTARVEAKAPSFLGAYLFALVNPKAYAAIGAVYSSVTVIEGDPLPDAIVKVAALCLVIFTVNPLWLVFGSAFSRLLSDPKIGRVVNVVFAVLLVLSVAVLLVD